MNNHTRPHALLATAVLGLGFSGLHAQTRDYSFTFTTPATVATDTASWNYSNSVAYTSGTVSATPSPTLLVRGQSSLSDHAIVTTAGVTGYNIRTANTAQADFGYYIMNMNFSDLVPGEDVQVDFSFKILGNDTNNTINPNNWAVKYATGATSAGAASFANAVTTFNFVDNNATWTTISGSFIIPSGTGSTARGGILINAGTSGSGSTSAGSITVADIQIAVSSVSAIPEPSSYALLAGAAALAGVVVRRRRR